MPNNIPLLPPKQALGPAQYELYSFLTHHGLTAQQVNAKSYLFSSGNRSVALVGEYLPLIPQPFGSLCADKTQLMPVLTALGYQTPSTTNSQTLTYQVSHQTKSESATIPQLVSSAHPRNRNLDFDWQITTDEDQLAFAYLDQNGFFGLHAVSNYPDLQEIVKAATYVIPTPTIEMTKKLMSQLLEDFSPSLFMGAYFTISSQTSKVTLLFPSYFLTPHFTHSVEHEGQVKSMMAAYGQLIIDRLSS